MNSRSRSISVRAFGSLRIMAAAALLLGVMSGCSGGGGGDASPIANPDTYSSSRGQLTISRSSPGVLINDSGSGLTAELMSGPSRAASFTLNTNGSFTYVHNGTGVTTDSFTYRAKNGTGASSPTTVTLSITPPVAVADSISINAPGGPPVSGNVLTNDDPNSGLTAELVTPPLHHQGAFTLNSNGSFTYTHNNDSAITDSFTYRAKVGAITSNTVTVTININQPPLGTNACVSSPANYVAGGAITGKLPGSDPNGDAPVFSIPASNVSTKGSATTDAAGNFSYQPVNASVRGMDRFTFTVTDSQNSSLSTTYTAWVFIGGTNNNPPPALRIMPLGDSITEGITVGNLDQPPAGERVGYRKKLYDDLTALAEGKYTVDFVGSQSNGADAGLTDTNHEGHPGWCDDNSPNCAVSGGKTIAGSVGDFLTTNPADVVLLHIGTNHFDPNNTGVNTILDNINSWATSAYYPIATSADTWPVSVFVARIIDDVPPETREVTAFNDNVATIATHRTKTRVSMVDHESALNYAIDASPTCLADGSCAGDMADGVHPNPSGYRKMAQKWYGALVSSGILPSCP